MDGLYNSKHGDDMKLVLYCTHGWALKSRGVGGGAQPPHLQTQGSGQPSPTANMAMT